MNVPVMGWRGRVQESSAENQATSQGKEAEKNEAQSIAAGDILEKSQLNRREKTAQPTGSPYQAGDFPRLLREILRHKFEHAAIAQT